MNNIQERSAMPKTTCFIVFFAAMYLVPFTMVESQELIPDILIVNFKEEIGIISVAFKQGIARVGCLLLIHCSRSTRLLK
jgi:hypothetical protein